MTGVQDTPILLVCMELKYNSDDCTTLGLSLQPVVFPPLFLVKIKFVHSSWNTIHYLCTMQVHTGG